MNNRQARKAIFGQIATTLQQGDYTFDFSVWVEESEGQIKEPDKPRLERAREEIREEMLRRSSE